MASAFDRRRLDTVQLVPPTPFTPDGRKLVADRLGRLIHHLATAGIKVFLPAAGTGEFHSLTPAEIFECVRVTRQSAPPDCVVVGPIGLAADHAVELGRTALEEGADTLLLMPPIHPYLCDQGFRDYVESITDRLGVPLLVYKRGPAPSDKLLLELAHAGRVLGIKYAVNDLDAFNRFAAAASGNVGLYCGTAERFAPFFMLAGATGYTSGSGSICPRLTLALHQALAQGKYRDAMQLLSVLRPLEDYRARDGESYNIAAVKFAVGLRGEDFGPCRAPQRRLTPADQDEIRRIAGPLLEA